MRRPFAFGGIVSSLVLSFAAAGTAPLPAACQAVDADGAWTKEIMVVGLKKGPFNIGARVTAEKQSLPAVPLPAPAQTPAQASAPEDKGTEELVWALERVHISPAGDRRFLADGHYVYQLKHPYGGRTDEFTVGWGVMPARITPGETVELTYSVRGFDAEQELSANWSWQLGGIMLGSQGGRSERIFNAKQPREGRFSFKFDPDREKPEKLAISMEMDTIYGGCSVTWVYAPQPASR